jgi:hypothetical protein
MRLPSLVSIPLRRTADVASTGSVVLARTAEVLRAVAGQEARSLPVERVVRTATSAAPSTVTPSSASTPASAAPSPPAGGSDRPVRSDEDDHTLGRSAGERREPTPSPAKGASAAQAKSRRTPSGPKEASKVRRRTTRAASLTTVETGGGSGRGGTPSTGKAENSPKARASAKAGREPAPMGSKDDSES